ncbi:PilZ domain-containing protein [Massilia endophytica]|uniref:PilZ domain-containing protein n=1 Tax=Massilia endophytica TaxID=2899220 RepID=UPI001E4DC08E|nr:PilZ domain-containing protein [Massilia endophytica]UGQ44799.1 PilZ domain-containing protein [Massilia endophytica]
MDQRREHVRRLLQVQATVTELNGGAVRIVQIIDIARMGVAFVTPYPMIPDRSYRFCFAFPGSSVRNDAVIDLVYSRPFGSEGRFRNGARFQSLPQESVDLIVDYVTSGAFEAA